MSLQIWTMNAGLRSGLVASPCMYRSTRLASLTSLLAVNSVLSAAHYFAQLSVPIPLVPPAIRVILGTHGIHSSITMGADGFPSYPDEPFYEFVVREWDMICTCSRQDVVAEFFDPIDGVLYVAYRKSPSSVRAMLIVDKGEKTQDGVVWRFSRRFSESECPVYANPPDWFLRLLTPPDPGYCGSLIEGERSWRDTAAANVAWRKKITDAIAATEPGSILEFRQPSEGINIPLLPQVCFATVGEFGSITPLVSEGVSWPGFANVILYLASGGVMLTHNRDNPPDYLPGLKSPHK